MISIEKNKIYESNGYRFKNFILLSVEEKKMVLEWRNSPDIRKWMYNRDEISLQDHFDFIDGLKERDDRYYWLVFDPKGRPMGVFNVVDVDRNNEIAETGNYARPSNLLDSFNFSKEYFNFYFNVLGFSKMFSASDAKNDNILMFTNFWGIKYNRTETKIVDGETVTYNICDSYTRESFMKRYNLGIKDFILYIKTKK